MLLPTPRVTYQLIFQRVYTQISIRSLSLERDAYIHFGHVGNHTSPLDRASRCARTDSAELYLAYERNKRSEAR
jgi:hypothetical protein